MKKVLIIDDEEAIRFSLSEGLKDMGYSLETADSAKVGLIKARSFRPHLVFLDIRLPDRSGSELLIDLKKEMPLTQVVMITAYGDTESTVNCIKQGAYNYVNKPLDLDIIISIARQVFKEERQDDFIGESKQMKEVFNKIETVASSADMITLIEGETGTGKELVASSIHMASRRKDKNFEVINCGAIPDNLIESELFGYEKNAFTGANEAKKGLIELAHGGTLLLDEIGEFPYAMQPKLLRFLETKTIKRVGGHKEIIVDAHIIAATNRDLKKEVDSKRFRVDLYYRLNVFPIKVPPLRKRKDDIPHMVDYFIKMQNKKNSTRCSAISQEALNVLLEYDWPGNVRELKNLIERLILIHHNEEMIQLEHLPADIIAHSAQKKAEEVISDREESTKYPFKKLISSGLNEVLEEQEKEHLKKFLDMYRWNISKTSEALGLSRYALKRRIDKYFPEDK